MSAAADYASSMHQMSLAHSRLAAKGGPSTGYHVTSSTQLMDMARDAEDASTPLGAWLASIRPPAG